MEDIFAKGGVVVMYLCRVNLCTVSDVSPKVYRETQTIVSA